MAVDMASEKYGKNDEDDDYYRKQL